jgi:hypothetical protein
MTIRDVTQDIDPAPEPECPGQPTPEPPASSPQADGNSESLHRAEKPTVAPRVPRRR